MENEMEVLYGDSASIINMPDEQFINLFFIDILVDGEKIPLVFDTGASITAISESVANSIGALPSSDSIIVGGNTGRTEKVTKGTIPMFQIGNNTIKNISVITVPDNQLDFGFDKEGNKLSVNGFLGWDVINKFKWMINPHKRTYIIEKPERIGNEEQLFWDNMPIINVKYDNHQMYFGFDSGNTESMFSKEFIPYLKAKEEKVDEIAGVGGIIEEEVYLINSIELTISNQNIELENISVLKRDVFPTTDFKVMGLLATDIIQSYNCVIDFENHNFKLI